MWPVKKTEFPVDGYLSFEFNEKQYKLDINKEDDGSFFVRFSDLTSKENTQWSITCYLIFVRPQTLAANSANSRELN
jgi:uncharacterized protein (DUF1684 family)